MIFLDANFLISLFVKEHEFHHKAIEIWTQNKNKEKIISNLIIMEVITVLSVKLKENLEVIEYAYKYMNDNLAIIKDYNEYDTAMEKIKEYYPERIPLFDCVYMALMEDLGIKGIVSFDEHFDNKKEIIRIH